MSGLLRVHAGTPVVVDSSVAFKWFDTAEPGAEAARDLLDAHGRDDIVLIAPAHLPLEVANVHISRGAAVEDVAEAIAALAAADLLIVPVDDDLLVDAAHIARADGLALYDAAFVALAARLDAELVTADRRQASTRSCRVLILG